MYRLSIFLIFGGILFLSMQQIVMGNSMHLNQDNTKNIPIVTYCDLVRNSEKYDGKEVTVYATYKYGIEIQELLCLECGEAGQIWLDEDNLDERVRKKIPKYAGIINGVFTGIFQSSKGPFGHGGYRFKLAVKAVKNIQVIYKGLPPPSLDLRRKMCGGTVSSGKKGSSD